VHGSGAPPVSTGSTVILLDRDGVITEPVPDPLTGTHESPLHPRDVRLVAGAARALAALTRCGHTLIVASNQPAAAKGIVPLSELTAVHERTVELLAAEGVELDGWEYCFHHPDGKLPELTGACDCRKPNDGMLRRALAAIGADPARAWMVGDSDSDVQAGASAGTRTALVAHPDTQHRRKASSRPSPDLRITNLLQFAELVCTGAEVA
jgi:D-glycero-D-manno-heptose 1,7-bisphosphate phosphatase